MSDSPDGIRISGATPAARRVSGRIIAVLSVLVMIILGLFVWGGEKRRKQAVKREDARQVSAANPGPILGEAPTSQRAATTIKPAVQTAPEPKPTQRQVPQVRHTAYRQQPMYEPQAPMPPAPPQPTPAQIAEQMRTDRLHMALIAPTTPRREAQQSGVPGAPMASGFTPQQPFAAPSDPARGNALMADEYTLTNMQPDKTAFARPQRGAALNTYLQHVRTPQFGTYEIKAGWEIPAALEQAINSDLPGELKALVTQNVYDTATGKYLLIPQGSRLIGAYNSAVSYGQDGVQVSWDRIIFPDGSSISLEGMTGMDSEGNAGLRQKVDRHYRRTFGMAFLTSIFTAAFDLTQRRQNFAYGYPSAGETASGAVGRELSQTGAQITRRNLMIQPTIRVQAGYRFNVRVNRDMLFAAPYEAMLVPEPEPAKPNMRQVKR